MFARSPYVYVQQIGRLITEYPSFRAGVAE